MGQVDGHLDRVPEAQGALARGDLRTLWIQTTNPWVTLPNRSRFDRTPNDGRFIVVSDIYPTPTTAIADMILPAAA